MGSFLGTDNDLFLLGARGRGRGGMEVSPHVRESGFLNLWNPEFSKFLL